MHEGVLSAFAECAHPANADPLLQIHLRSERDEVERAHRAATKRHRIRRVRAKAVAGKVCKHVGCGKPVARTGKKGAVPDYCSPACMRRAKWARWYETHREERLAQRAEQRRAAA